MPRSLCRHESPRTQAGRRRIRKVGERFLARLQPARPAQNDAPPRDSNRRYRRLTRSVVRCCLRFTPSLYIGIPSEALFANKACPPWRELFAVALGLNVAPRPARRGGPLARLVLSTVEGHLASAGFDVTPSLYIVIPSEALFADEEPARCGSCGSWLQPRHKKLRTSDFLSAEFSPSFPPATSTPPAKCDNCAAVLAHPHTPLLEIRKTKCYRSA